MAGPGPALHPGGKMTQQESECSRIAYAFLEQYYTLLHEDPSRLHCFYTKASTLVHSPEGSAHATLCYGQQDIHDKIMSLGFDKCTAWISNVDSQGSAEGGIVVMVIGWQANAGKSWRKFARTFFLAAQPNGYFVLNDICRMLNETGEDEVPQAADEHVVDGDAHAAIEAEQVASAPQASNTAAETVHPKVNGHAHAQVASPVLTSAAPESATKEPPASAVPTSETPVVNGTHESESVADVEMPIEPAQTQSEPESSKTADANPAKAIAEVESKPEELVLPTCEAKDQPVAEGAAVDAPASNAATPAKELEQTQEAEKPAESAQSRPAAATASVAPAPPASPTVSARQTSESSSAQQASAEASASAAVTSPEVESTPASASTPAPAPTPAKPAAPKSWASLAASNTNKWGSAVVDTKGISSTVPASAVASSSSSTSRVGGPGSEAGGSSSKQQQQSQPQGNRRRGDNASGGSSSTKGGGNSAASSPTNVQNQIQYQATTDRALNESVLAIKHSSCFVKGVQENVSDKVLKDALNKFGPMRECDIIRQKACAFVEFERLDSARRAIQASLRRDEGGDGGIVLGPGMIIHIVERKPKDDRPPPKPRTSGAHGESGGSGGGQRQKQQQGGASGGQNRQRGSGTTGQGQGGGGRQQGSTRTNK
ncbi:hypothetical protein ACM66B_003531 [Microbotryomycetes sp. NB124-2]